jgi:hypothetical protein
MNGKPQRRWFSFSLRTMFILVTAICCWLAWESSVVRGRQALLRELRGRPAIQITTAEAQAQQLPPGATLPPAASIPLVRKWLGDRAIQEISYGSGYHNLSRADLDRIARTFPEAQLREYELPLEPCHPGCFPRGTLVDTPRGERAIESIQVGDALTAVLRGGEAATVNVQSVFVTRNRLWRIETEDGVLLTTEKQPLCRIGQSDTSGGTTGEFFGGFMAVPAGQLQPGDRILRRTDGELRAVNVLKVSRTDRIEKVFNLVLGNSEVFVAGGFLARSKPPAQ